MTDFYLFHSSTKQLFASLWLLVIDTAIYYCCMWNTKSFNWTMYYTC